MRIISHYYKFLMSILYFSLLCKLDKWVFQRRVCGTYFVIIFSKILADKNRLYFTYLRLEKKYIKFQLQTSEF